MSIAFGSPPSCLNPSATTKEREEKAIVGEKRDRCWCLDLDHGREQETLSCVNMQRTGLRGVLGNHGR